jgi:hypothetical protein
MRKNALLTAALVAIAGSGLASDYGARRIYDREPEPPRPRKPAANDPLAAEREAWNAAVDAKKEARRARRMARA